MDTYTTTPLTNWLKLINQYPSGVTSLSNYYNSNNITEKDGVYSVEFKVPGYEKDEIKISYDGSNVRNKFLTVKAENKQYGKFSEQIPLTASVEEKSINASLRNGILKVSFTLEKEKSKFIEIKLD